MMTDAEDDDDRAATGTTGTYRFYTLRSTNERRVTNDWRLDYVRARVQ
jgi:hypothetical protein